MLAAAKRPTLALDVNIVQDNLPIEIAPKIFIGSIHAAFNQEALLSLKITHILNASRLPPSFPKNFTYLSVDVRDKEDANILSCIPSTNIFIEAGIEAGGVLVHCFGGRSRSAAFIAAYLMCNCGWTYDKVISMIVAARPVASVNKGFEKQLRAYALTNYDVYATQQVLLRNRIKALHAIRGQNSVNSKCHDRIDGSWKENAKGGNKRLWGDRDSRGAGGIILMLQQEKDRRAEEGVEDEKQDSDREDSFEESNNRQDYSLEEIQGDRKVYGAPASPEAILHDVKPTSPYRIDNFNFENKSSPFSQYNEVNRRNKSSDSRLTASSESSRNIQIPYLDPKSPRCRLSRPGSSTVRVIPPLRGLEREVCCAHCGEKLFCLANVLRIEDNKILYKRKTEQDNDRFNNLNNYNNSSSPPSSSSNTSSPSLSNPNSNIPSTSTSGTITPSSSFPSIPSQLLAVEMKDLKKDFKFNIKNNNNNSNNDINSNNNINDEDLQNDIKTHTIDTNKDLRKDLKRDYEGEHKQEFRSLERTVLPCISGNYSDQKVPPQSCRASNAKKFDFDFGRPPGSVSVKLSNGRVTNNFRVGFEREEETNQGNGNGQGQGQGQGQEQEQGALSTMKDDCIEGFTKNWKDNESTDDSIKNSWSRHSSHERNVLPGNSGWNNSPDNFENVTSSWSKSQKMLETDDDDDDNNNKDNRNKSYGRLHNNQSNSNSILSPYHYKEKRNNTMPRLWGSERPQSAEKRRWLARMSLLSMSVGPQTYPTQLFDDTKIYDAQNRMKQIAQDDEEAMRITFAGTGVESSLGEIQHLYLEYLGWMDPTGSLLGLPVTEDINHENDNENDNDNGNGIGNGYEKNDVDSGRIKCRHCHRAIGNWTWRPTAAESLRGQVEPPIFMILKSDILQADFPLDPTPQSTPRPLDGTEERCGSGSGSRVI